MSVVDTVEILKGRALKEDEYFKAAVIGWCVELVRASINPIRTVTKTLLQASSFLPGLRRYYGRFHHTSWSTLLVPPTICRHDRN